MPRSGRKEVNMTGTEIQVHSNNYLNFIDKVDVQQMKVTMTKVATLRATIKNILVEGTDYGTIPGCGDKPALLKPGAEKTLIALGVSCEYELVEKTEKFDDKGFFAYTVKCSISHSGNKITEGLGHANSKEQKWAFKWVTEKQLPDGLDKNALEKKEFKGQYGSYFKYKVDEDANSKANTILKMAKKRAQVDATLALAGLSDIFTQEDLVDGNVIDVEPSKPKNGNGNTNRNITMAEKDELKEKIGASEFASLMNENKGQLSYNKYLELIV